MRKSISGYGMATDGFWEKLVRIKQRYVIRKVYGSLRENQYMGTEKSCAHKEWVKIYFRIGSTVIVRR